MESQPRLSLREEQKNLTRSRLLDAAVTVLNEKSVFDATMEDIAKAANISRVTVYAHFPGKGEIVQALAERMYNLMGEAFADLAALPRFTRAGVRQWLGATADRWRAMTSLLRAVRPASSLAARAPFSPRDRYLEAQARYVSTLVGDSARWRDVPDAQARQRAAMVVLQTESFMTAWVQVGIPLDTEDPLELLADSLCFLLEPAIENDARRPPAS
ncbi:hypothetical protein Amsp01_049290 [Amycolatopsis sp. NBRC 101858]|uniref:TetR/AcrR family transcriptional regulator n=1 Tax=Amycolatopsis sp. NBRC 101858 TaxID=3032200 RepID=UPI0024A3972B|nr:TetR/AcrR family transcriptional regulator [Amycolatopsis sp. NBRC 101858]GLY38905.1 hypothetical protein Amsp01_049290 [Amycolatopsis sp. NBRC 101858]